MRTTHLMIGLILLVLVLPASPAQAGGVVSVCDEAHLLAALAGGGTVTFGCSGTVILTAEIAIAADTTIDGSEQSVIISGNHAVRVFIVDSGVTLNLTALAIADGNSTTFDSGGDGGGIHNRGTLKVSNSSFFGNTAAFGGAIYNTGTLVVNNSSLSGNAASNYCGDGGAIYNTGMLTVSNSTFSGNSARCFYSGGGGGGILNAGRLDVSNSTFASNNAPGGGGITNRGTATLSNSAFIGNRSWYGYGGGGILSSGGTLTVNNCAFASNSAVYGGGISNNYDGMLTMSNSTFSDNIATYDGGGIYNAADTLTVSNSTFSGGSADRGGGIFRALGTVTLKNTVVANSPTGGNCVGDILDGGGNLSYPDATCPGINSDPVLGPLHDNGGPTQTMALGAGSAARDAGDDAICAAPPVNNLDQRGVTRPRGAHCDIGAYEAIPAVYLPLIRR